METCYFAHCSGLGGEREGCIWCFRVVSGVLVVGEEMNVLSRRK